MRAANGCARRSRRFARLATAPLHVPTRRSAARHGLGADAELPLDDGDSDPAVHAFMSSIVAGAAEEHESVRPHRLEVVDRDVLPRSAQETGLLGYLTRSDERPRHVPDLAA